MQMNYLRSMVCLCGAALGIGKALTQFFLHPSWQHFSVGSQLASSKQRSSWSPGHMRGSTVGQKPGFPVVQMKHWVPMIFSLTIHLSLWMSSYLFSNGPSLCWPTLWHNYLLLREVRKSSTGPSSYIAHKHSYTSFRTLKDFCFLV